MAKTWDFRLPTAVRFGHGAAATLGHVARGFGNAALVIGYQEPAGLAESYAQAVKNLEAAGLRVRTFFAVAGEPDPALADRAAAEAIAGGATVVVGIGGGSVLDTAKTAAMLVHVRKPLESLLEGAETPAPEIGPAACLALPTTAGTGSEVSDVAVFRRRLADGREQKAAIYGGSLRPSVAIVDPDLVATCPRAVMAASGADALAHALEARFSRRANPLSTLMAEEAIALVWGNFRSAVHGEPGAVEAMALAALLGGAAFSSAGVGIAHALAGAIGAVLHVPHAQAVRWSLEASLRFNLLACPEDYASLADRLHIQPPAGRPPAGPAAPDALVDGLAALLFDVDPTWPAYALDDSLLDALVAAARQSRAPLAMNPRRASADDLRQLLVNILQPPED